MEQTGEVTLAVLGEKIDSLTRLVREQNQQIDEQQKAISAHDILLAVLTSRYDGMDSRVKAWSLANSLGAVIACIIGAVAILLRK